MQLSAKPDFDRATDAWDHFWAGEIVRRPIVVASVTRPGFKPVWTGGERYLRAVHGRHREQMDLIDRWLESTIFLAEAIPYFMPDYGPDQFAAFLGGKLVFSEESGDTNWIEPWVDDWDAVLPLELDESNPTWRGVLEYSRLLADHARGRYLVAVCDLHSNMDTLLAMRGSERLCMDLYDCPDRIEAAMLDVRKLYRPVYEALYEAGGMNAQTGSTGWTPFWTRGRFATIQCDFLCMVSPEFSRKLIIPALEEEASFLDRCVLHFDGPGALPHLDDVLAIDAIDAVQWVPGAGQKPMHEWTDVLLRCQKAGKGLQIYGVGPEQVKALHKILSPEKVAYCVGVESEDEARELTDWLEKNT
jgi:hypothetical protein